MVGTTSNQNTIQSSHRQIAGLTSSLPEYSLPTFLTRPAPLGVCRENAACGITPCGPGCAFGRRR